jgi:hypothetical protein
MQRALMYRAMFVPGGFTLIGLVIRGLSRREAEIEMARGRLRVGTLVQTPRIIQRLAP